MNWVINGIKSSMKLEKYSMSFTTGGIFHQESIQITALYLDFMDWSAVRDYVHTENVLQTRTISTAKKRYREINTRLQQLNLKELETLAESSAHDQKYLLWLAICRRYPFIGDFSIEVIRERYITLKSDLHYEDYDFFFSKKAESHPELEKIKRSSQNKLRQVLFKMLREADLLLDNNLINAAMLTPQLINLISASNSNDLLFFPVFDSELAG